MQLQKRYDDVSEEATNSDFETIFKKYDVLYRCNGKVRFSSCCFLVSVSWFEICSLIGFWNFATS